MTDDAEEQVIARPVKHAGLGPISLGKWTFRELGVMVATFVAAFNFFELKMALLTMVLMGLAISWARDKFPEGFVLAFLRYQARKLFGFSFVYLADARDTEWRPPVIFPSNSRSSQR